MHQSRNFKETQIIIEGGNYEMEYELGIVDQTSWTCFGNIYINPEDPLEFTFFTVNNLIEGHTPLNRSKDFFYLIAMAALDNEIRLKDEISK